uniref:Uncharacterized protein n=1 Tax=Arundo donax TaxID=35708 RepID=A0A0A9BEB3_ARUDO
MALPSLDVAPVRNTSLTLPGISLRITAAVRVFPCTTLTLRFGCLLTNSVPPPLSASFLFSAARLSTLTPILSALRMASSI